MSLVRDSSATLAWVYSDENTEALRRGATLRLASRHRLTVYDAAYLEMALRRGLPLATVERELRAAAKAEGIPLLGIGEPE